MSSNMGMSPTKSHPQKEPQRSFFDEGSIPQIYQGGER
jgi:hypothetical protein